MRYAATVSREGKFTLIEFPDAPSAAVYAEPGEDVREVAREALEDWLARELRRGDAPGRPASGSPPGDGDGFWVNVDPSLSVRLQLRWARQDAGISQGQLAAMVGVSRQQISLLESADANLTLRTLERVAGALGLSVEIALVPENPARQRTGR